MISAKVVEAQYFGGAAYWVKFDNNVNKKP